MAYTPNYTEGDIATSFLDGLTKVVLTVGSLITVIVVLFIYVWVKKKLK